jgi:hypothetical protein
MERGIVTLPMDPYNGTQYLTVVFGIGVEDLKDRLKPNGVYYDRPVRSLYDIRYRTNKYNRLMSLFEEHNFMIEVKDGFELLGEVLYEDSGNVMFMYLPYIDFKNCSRVELFKFLGTVSHECVHVCQRFLINYFDRDVEIEAEAYFHTYLFENIVDALERELFV